MRRRFLGSAAVAGLLLFAGAGAAEDPQGGHAGGRSPHHEAVEGSAYGRAADRIERGRAAARAARERAAERAAAQRRDHPPAPGASGPDPRALATRSPPRPAGVDRRDFTFELGDGSRVIAPRFADAPRRVKPRTAESKDRRGTSWANPRFVD